MSGMNGGTFMETPSRPGHAWSLPDARQEPAAIAAADRPAWTIAAMVISICRTRMQERSTIGSTATHRTWAWRWSMPVRTLAGVAVVRVGVASRTRAPAHDDKPAILTGSATRRSALYASSSQGR